MILYLIILLAAITRFIPHLPNFAPITALAIFSAANLGWKKAAGLTLVREAPVEGAELGGVRCLLAILESRRSDAA